MSTVQIRPVLNQVGYRFNQLSVNDDGSISLNMLVGSLLQTPATQEGAAPSVSFQEIAQKGFYLSAQEAALVMDHPASEDEKALTLRELLLARCEIVLRQAGRLTV